jgi:transcriptional regulator with XRE-family HTH domain
METIKTYKVLRNIPTQRELSKELGVTEAYVSMLLAGKRKSPKMLARINQILERKLRKSA